MKKTCTLLLTIILICLTGCEDKKSQESNTPIENTTDILSPKGKVQHDIHENKTNNTAPATTSRHTFVLNDIEQSRYTISIDNKSITSTDITAPLILINLFATWCPPCRGEIPYLSDLQKKYKNKLFIAGVLVNDRQNNSTLKTFIKKHHADYYISNSEDNDAFAAQLVKGLQLPENFPLPLTVLYKKGNYYIHYEGAVPVEMIEHDIQEAIK
ncbi:TlpA disulfide reductase family protein [Sulfurovum sp.]|uniref:TlpA family protein disulfide reductase n=1 Tax=Sulfurovum sp. TaxID=1969726 RepID=UPI0025EDF075|nr:TlpA disulfide reductase family protein [Sulfurovum sp.]